MNRATLFELPPALCVNNLPSLAALVARDEKTMSVAKIFLGKNFDFSGEPPSTFELIQTLTRFAQHGELTTAYPAETLCIDLELGCTVQLDGPDTIIEEVTPFDALANKLLLFMDGEILSIAEATMIEAGRYELMLVRGRFGTPIQPHAAGTEVFIMRQADLMPLNLPSLLAGNTGQFKIVRGADNVEDISADYIGFIGRSWKLPPPSILAVNGLTIPLVDTSEDMVITWKLPIAGLSGKRVSTLLEFVVPGENIVSVLVPWSSESLTKAWADLAPAAEDGFTLRASTQVDDGDNIISGPPISIVVNVLGAGGGGAAAAPHIDYITPDSTVYSDPPEFLTVIGSGFTTVVLLAMRYTSELDGTAGIYEEITLDHIISDTELRIPYVGQTYGGFTYVFITTDNGVSNGYPVYEGT